MVTTDTTSQKHRLTILTLFANHIDAWGVTLIIGSVALLSHQAFSGKALALLVGLTACFWLGFALNDYFDAPVDADDPHKAARNFFVQRHIAPSTLWLVFTAISLVVCLIFVQFGLRGIAIFVTGFVVMWAYSAPPLRLKGRPVLDLLIHALFVETFPYFVILFLLDLRWLPLDYVILGTLFLASLAAQLEQQIRDFKLDSQSGTNFTIRFGLPVTVRLLRITTSLIILMIAGASIGGVIPGFLLPLCLIALPLMLHRLTRGREQPRSETLVRVTLLVALLYTSIVLTRMVLPPV